MTNKRSIPKYYGQGGRLKSKPSQLLIDTAYAHDCNDGEILIEGMHYADIAYAIMLIEEEIIPRKEGLKLLDGLIEASNIAPEDFPINPEHGDVYNSKDVYIRSIIGDIAGWIHAGRPRREAVNIGYLIAMRKSILSLANDLEDIAKTLLKASIEYANVIMPDYTYLLHAHPTTLGHYLLTFVYPILRDFERMKMAYKHINKCPGGSGSVNGSRLPLDRERIASLLEFDGISLHTRDAMWQIDTPIEMMSVLCSIMTNLNRLGDELQIWNTEEFNLIELPDEYCRASVIMPQKKNPYPLAYFRGVTSSLIGKVSQYMSHGKGVTGNPDSRVFIYGDLPRSLATSGDAINLLARVIDGIEINKEIMISRVMKDYTFATDITDYLMMTYKFDYRVCHQIMGMVISELNANKIKGSDLKINQIENAILKITGKKVKLEQKKIESIIQPQNIINSRKTLGGASEENLKKMHADVNSKLSQFTVWRSECEQKFLNIKPNLLAEKNKL